MVSMVCCIEGSQTLREQKGKERKERKVKGKLGKFLCFRGTQEKTITSSRCCL